MAGAVLREAVAEDLAEGYRGMDVRELQRLSKVGLIRMHCFVYRLQLFLTSC